MPGTESSNKVCVVCGKDVSGKPRVKDAQGRYTCAGDCQATHAANLKKAAQERPKGGTTPSRSASVPMASVPLSDEGSMLSDLISQSPMLKAGKCEQCGSIMPQGGVVCTRCGFNTQTGKNLKTAVIVEKEKKEPKFKPGKYKNPYGGPDGPGFWKLFAYMSLGFSLVSFTVFLGPMGVLAGIVILGIAGLLCWVANLISAFRNDQTLWGILMLVVVIPFVPGIAQLLFNIFANDDDNSKALYWALIVAGAAFGAMLTVAAMLGFNVDLTSNTLSPTG